MVPVNNTWYQVIYTRHRLFLVCQLFLRYFLRGVHLKTLAVFSASCFACGSDRLRTCLLAADNHEETLRVVQTDNDAVVATLFEAEGTLGKRTRAHIATTGAFVLDLTMTTGFDQTETTVMLWTAPETEGRKGTYARQALLKCVPRLHFVFQMCYLDPYGTQFWNPIAAYIYIYV